MAFVDTRSDRHQGQSQVPQQGRFAKTLVAQSVSAAVIASVGGTAVAQEIEEIIVSATKRDENIQDVPLAITAMTGDFIRDVNLDDIKDLVTFAPGVTGNSTDAFIDGISVRGVRTQDFGVGGDPSAAFFKNNLYEGRNGAVVTSLYDLERAEVLRGPQNFLFGRNAIGGAFSVHTRKPTADGSPDGYVDVDVAEKGRFIAEGAMDFEPSGNFATRVALYHSTEDGHVANDFDGRDLLGHDKTAIRVSGIWGGDKWEAFGTIEFESFDRDGSVYRASTQSPRLAIWESLLGPVNMPTDPRDINSDLDGGTDDDADILTLGFHFDYDFDNMALSWSTGYKDHDYLYIEDYDGTPRTVGTYEQDQTGDYFQTELRLTSTGDGPLSWYVGVSLYEENIDVAYLSALEEEAVCAYYGAYYYAYNCSDYFDYWQAYYDAYYYPYPNPIVVGPFVPTANGLMEERTFVNGKYSGWAAYVDLTWAISDELDVSFGVRHTYDEKTFSTRTPPPASTLQSYFLPGYMTTGLTDKNDWSETTPRIVARWRPMDDHMIFASYTEGYKSGGFGTFSLFPAVFQWFGDGADAPLTPADGFVPAQFRPEDVESIEIGYKGRLFDGRVAFDVTGFTYDYTDLQVNFFDGGAQVGNAGDVEGEGVEANLQWAINDKFDLLISGGWLDTEVRQVEFLCDGAPDANGILDGDPTACEGSSLHWAPEYMGSAMLRTTIPVDGGTIISNLETFWEGERGGGYENIIDSKLPSFQEWSFRIGYHSDNNWNVTGYVENLTDELNYAGSQNNSGITPAWFVGPNRPRTVGVRYGYSFD